MGNGHEVVDDYEDPVLSGSLPVDERPGLMAALVEIEEDRADGLVVHRLDRLARELHVQEAALATVWKVESRAVFETVGGEVLRDDPDDPMRTAMRQVAGVFGQLERGMLRARLQGGRRRKARGGGWIGGGRRLHRRYGHRLVEREGGREYEPVPEEQAVIVRIRELRAAGSTWQSICDALADEVPAPDGSVWYPATVRKLALREEAVTPDVKAGSVGANR